MTAQNERCKVLESYEQVRSWTERICETLEPEDYVVQSMPDASPAKWHLAHTSWFYETFLLKPHLLNYQSLHPQYDYLFNSYYNSIGERHCRAKRGVVSRPTVPEVMQYRNYIDIHMSRLINDLSEGDWQVLAPLLSLGINHEQQHQELILTDIKHLFSENPLCPIFQRKNLPVIDSREPEQRRWIAFPAGLQTIGSDDSLFVFDNETPCHPEYIAGFELAETLITNREWLEFVEDGGYQRPEFWLSEGWNVVQSRGWNHPLYWWKKLGSHWHEFTLFGMIPLVLDQPVCHISLYEADAFAHWSGARLPTEFEWEFAAKGMEIAGNFAESELFHPVRDETDHEGALVRQMFGDVWEWTRSQYSPYPGYRQAEGALGEYNGKFMCSQFVLRGGSCATPISHIRPTYRNFFPPDSRWQFSGIRLARDIS